MNDFPSEIIRQYYSKGSWEEYFVNILKQVAARASCLRRQVAAIAVTDRRIIATGYNGTPSGVPHCEKVGCLRIEKHVKSGERHEICMDGDTKVKLHGTFKTIRELAESNSNDLLVYSYKNGGEIVQAKACQPRYVGKRECVKITLDNGAEIICTPDHKILGRDEKFVEASALKSGSTLMAFDYDFLHDGDIEALILSNHKVVSVESVGMRDVYDLTVPEYENYAIYAGGMSCLFTHNCRAVHAEQNLIIQAAKFGISLSNSDVYCTHLPCFICFKMLVNCGVNSIYFLEGYPDEMTLDMYTSNISSLPRLIYLRPDAIDGK